MNSFLSRLLPENVCLPYPTGTTLYAFIFVYDIEESSGEMPSLTFIPGEYNRSILVSFHVALFCYGHAGYRDSRLSVTLAACGSTVTVSTNHCDGYTGAG